MIDLIELARSNERLKEEAGYVRLWDNGNGISWDFVRNPDKTFERIAFGLDYERRIVLEVNALTKGRWPERRQATAVEITAFVLVANAAFPGNGHVDNLVRVAATKIREDGQLLLDLIHTVR